MWVRSASRLSVVILEETGTKVSTAVRCDYTTIDSRDLVSCSVVFDVALAVNLEHCGHGSPHRIEGRVRLEGRELTALVLPTPDLRRSDRHSRHRSRSCHPFPAGHLTNGTARGRRRRDSIHAVEARSAAGVRHRGRVHVMLGRSDPVRLERRDVRPDVWGGGGEYQLCVDPGFARRVRDRCSVMDLRAWRSDGQFDSHRQSHRSERSHRVEPWAGQTAVLASTCRPCSSAQSSSWPGCRTRATTEHLG
jgi:hypothetical protein